MDLAQLFIPFLKFTGIYITSFWSGGFTTPSAVNQINWNLENYIFVHFEITFLTTLTGILDFADLIFQTGIFFLVWKQTGYFYQFKLYFSPSFLNPSTDRQEERITFALSFLTHIFLNKVGV